MSNIDGEGYIIWDPCGIHILASLRGHADTSKLFICKILDRPWYELEAMGYRVVKVQLTPLKDDET